jgi:mRNA interferase HicA
MKRNLLIKKLNTLGCILIRHGSKHDIYHNPLTGKTQPVPRHSEINEILAKKIIKDLSGNCE